MVYNKVVKTFTRLLYIIKEENCRRATRLGRQINKMDNTYRLLDKIESVEDLRRLPDSDMDALASELRDFIIKRVKINGGHLSSNLGVIELTLALHRVFDTPKDKIIWDVGHQAYAHKILTSRKDAFASLRLAGGLSGFTKREESEFDPFGAGHSSTSISAAIGFAQAAALSGSDEHVICVIGDGALTGGLAHEALNNIKPDLHLIIILNDNEMSISKNTGHLAKHLAKIRSSKGYHNTKKATRSILMHIPLVGKALFYAVRATKKAFKNMFYKSNYFEDMGLYYLGPVDGHNYQSLSNLLNAAKEYKGASIIHVKTVKGKGMPEAEKAPDIYHGVNPEGQPSPETNFSLKMGEILCRRAENDENICAISAAMKDGCGLASFAERFPNRFFDVGIAEEHALVFAAGLAAAGKKPVFAVYSSFLQRGYDNILHDIALQGLPVTVCIDRAGVAAADGPTHNGVFDVAMLCGTPGAELIAPTSFNSLEKAMDLALSSDKPFFIRYPNSAELDITNKLICDGDGFIWHTPDDPASFDCFVACYGRVVSEAVIAANSLKKLGINCGVILFERLLPLKAPSEALLDILKEARPTAPLLFAEEGVKNGGFAMCLYEEIRSDAVMSERKYIIKAIENGFVKLQKGQNLYSSCNISAADIAASLIETLGK